MVREKGLGPNQTTIWFSLWFNACLWLYVAVYVAEKPDYEVGSKSKLSFAKKSNVAAVWKLDDNEEEERIDDEELLDEDDKAKPTEESLRGKHLE